MVDLKLLHEYTKNLHVLYVEDNETLRESTLKVLNNFFKEVHIAVDGLDGVDKYKTYQLSTEKTYDLIISDINMPYKNGVEMSEDILKVEPTQCIVFVTAHNELEYLHQSISLGISSFLLKPLNLQDLATVLFKVCRAISDRKLVEEHYTMMEDVNAQLENQNQALEAKNKEQKKLIRVLETMQSKVNKLTASTEVAQAVEEMNQSERKSSYDAQIEQLRLEDLSELTKIHEELDADIIDIIAGNVEYIPRVTELFSKYTAVLGRYSVFDTLTTSMGEFINATREFKYPKDSSKIAEIFIFLEAFMYILGKWQKDLLQQHDEKVVQLDLTIIADMESITNIWLSEEVAEEVKCF